ncbi:sigma 54-interacting transcriptional regulator [Mitsuokella multacida]|uniref:HTH-type transcriptional regulatory protein TyrR n=1 Tax=Mitsuokella multacida TaxID=52226 RepID=A0A356UK68_9FIRM|nr:sigma 54-interacting transcriptional regulator [Mitsuokella multacida]MCF2584173.1 sigma 54-interacting transcriptional regulator [Mitsuokella multacida]MDO5583523.1 sigma 54-interacting transcriptional regulator [Mitsuokella multacida]RHF51991.1 PAS domain S-box protein [Mitsuokella multacida]HBQ29561.1 Fis family transcriptional regulator [Mitsuokella multacida]
MIFEREAVIHDEGGIHARVAAMIVQRAQELCERYDCHLYIRSERSERCEMHSLMKLVALKVAQGDSVFVSSEGDNGRQAVIEMVRFLESDFIMNEASEIHGVDKLLHENALMQERLQMILESVQDGICVVDRSGEVTYVNPSYLRIVHKTPEMVVGQNVFETAADGNRCAVLRSGIARIGSIRHKKDGTTIVANVNPIFVDGEIAGVVSVIKDITEIQTLMERLSQVSAKAEYLEQELLRTKKTAQAFANYIGKSGKVVDVLALASKAADSSANVLIRGESGTGKEVIAEGIHYASGRRRGPFIRVNCGAIPGALLESELFGHEKGAFTGAVRRKLGKFELANHGTIFLDEIGELDKNLQVKLLRVLQQKEFDRVGGEETIHVDVRIIAATNRDLEAMVREGTFRDDLYYRLNVIPIILPPLRDRPDDIPLLVEHFIEKISKENKKDVRGITPDAMQMFMHYRWPGNVRELENVIERVITLMDTDLITAAVLPSYIKGDIAGREVQSLADDTVLPWEEYEKQIIANALRQGTSFNGAAKLLRISHKTVAAKARKYGLV